MGKYTDYVKERKEREADELYRVRYAKEYALVLSRLLNSRDFRFFISDLIGYTNPFVSPFDEKGNVSSFNAGKQQVGLKIFRDIIDISPDFFVQLMKDEQARAEFKSNFLKEALNDNTK